KVYTDGNIAPLCNFIEQHYYNVFDNRDYRWANELTPKTAFLSLLYNDILYIMDSETKIDRNYIDLTMIIRPDKRNLEIYDILIEFKYVKLSTVKLTGEQARSLSREELEELPCIKEQMNQAKIQAQKYSKKINQKYANLRLKSFAVVSLGFERLVWEKA
ncbi:AAA-ATPase-like protein, partial [Candidatus Magnetomorum sp. HK-1]